MGINKLQPQTTDLTKYSPFHDNITNSALTLASGNSITLKSINGMGYITDIVGYSNYTNGGYLKITIDGVVVVNVPISTAGNFVGIFSASNIIYNAGNLLYPYIYNSTLSTTPISSTVTFSMTYGDNKSLVINSPIYFNKSLLVEYVSNNGAQQQLYATMKGGYK